MKTKIKNHVKAAFGILSINTGEERRMNDMIKMVADELNRQIWVWTVTQGATNLVTSQHQEFEDPVEFLKFAGKYQQPSIFVMIDPEPFFEDVIFRRTLKDNIPEFRDGKTMIMIGVNIQIPGDLAHLIKTIDASLPSRKELEEVIKDCVEDLDLDFSADTMDKAITALSGLTTEEASDATALSIVESGNLDPEIISREKCAQLSKRDYLEVIEHVPTMDSVGGLENLKEWLNQRVRMFTKEAREFGLPTPKGFLTIGPPGTGKSLVAKATASILRVPLIKLDTGALYGSLVGESEKNVRDAIQIAEAMAPCVLWCDELDKQFGGSSQGTSDGHETTKRVMSSLLTWLQEKTSPVFIVATANNIQGLASSFPELLRKGRWDEIWFVDLPTEKERQDIFRIHVQKMNRSLENPEYPVLSTAADEFTGAEIEAAVKDAMFMAFANDHDLNKDTILEAIKKTVPQSQLAKNTIQDLRNWARSRARLASYIPDAIKKSRGISID